MIASATSLASACASASVTAVTHATSLFSFLSSSTMRTLVSPSSLIEIFLNFIFSLYLFVLRVCCYGFKIRAVPSHISTEVLQSDCIALVHVLDIDAATMYVTIVTVYDKAAIDFSVLKTFDTVTTRQLGGLDLHIVQEFHSSTSRASVAMTSETISVSWAVVSTNMISGASTSMPF